MNNAASAAVNKETTTKNVTTTTMTTILQQRNEATSIYNRFRRRSSKAKHTFITFIFLLFIILPLFQNLNLLSSFNNNDSNINSDVYSNLPQLSSQLVSKNQGVQVQDRDILLQEYLIQNDNTTTNKQRVPRKQTSNNSNTYSDLPQLTSQLSSKKNQVVQVQDRDILQQGYPTHNDNTITTKQRLPRKNTNVFILNSDICCDIITTNTMTGKKKSNWLSNAGCNHLLIDGIARSDILNRTFDVHEEDAVWVYMIFHEYPLPAIKQRIEESIVERKKRKKKRALDTTPNLTSDIDIDINIDNISVPSWEIYLIDESDSGYVNQPKHKGNNQIELLLGISSLLSSLDDTNHINRNHSGTTSTTNHTDNGNNNSGKSLYNYTHHRRHIHMTTRKMVERRYIRFEDDEFLKSDYFQKNKNQILKGIYPPAKNTTINTTWPIVNATIPFNRLGTKVNWTKPQQTKHIYGGKPRQFRYFVRSDIIDWIETSLNGTLYPDLDNNHNQQQYLDLVYDQNRTLADVAHFTYRKETIELRGHVNMYLQQMEKEWEIEQQEIQQQRNDSSYSNNKNKSKHNKEMITLMTSTTTSTSFTVTPHQKFFLGIVGGKGQSGRRSVQSQYCYQLLKSKIIVVGQRLKWEDHWRLMEALALGGLVFTDPSVGDLPFGLVEGYSIIVYHSLAELKTKIQYYLHPSNEKERLQIAYRGHHAAIDYHRSYQVLERIIFEEYPI